MYDPKQYQYGQAGGLKNWLMQHAMGSSQDTAASLQQKQGLDFLQRQLRASMAGMRGINPALASRRTTQAGNQLATQVLSQTAQQRAQEQAGFMQQLLGLEQMQGGAQAQANDILNQQSMLQYQLEQQQKDAWQRMIVGGLLNAGGSAASMFLGG